MERRHRRTLVFVLLLTVFGIAAGTSQAAFAPATTNLHMFPLKRNYPTDR